MLRMSIALLCLLCCSQLAAAGEIEKLRAEGPAGLEKILERHAALIAKHQDDDPSWRKARDEIDAVAAQRDAYASKLYWYTDLDQAQRAAKESGKPILSLRLLGKLDEELSCANSRLFRTTLYPDPKISKLLREKFVLHWQTVRPAPRITIDFGDGRKIERTITGNSIHYILDADARPIDALPGLYSAATFERGLNDALSLYESVKASKNRDQALRNWHSLLAGPMAALKAKPAKAVPARVAAPLAVSKGFVERPMLAALGQPVRSSDSFLIVDTRAMQFSPEVLSMINSKLRKDAAYPQGLIENLKRSIALDTAQNETLHTRLHQWFAAGDVSNLDALNDRVYAELFLTPSSDPWLGLAPDDVFAAIDDSGRR